MKTKFYLLTALMCFTLVAPAQKYKYMIFESWTNNSWKMTFRSTNNYDLNGNLISDYDEQWNNETSIWENISTNAHTLNPDGTIRESLSRSWNEESNRWETVSKTVFTYNESKKIHTEITQIFLESWMDSEKISYTYDSNGNLMSIVTQKMDLLSGMVLKNFSQTIYSYNEDKTENQIVYQIWNAANQWEDESRTTNTYNASKQLISDLSENWENNIWVNDSRSTNTYKANGTLSEVIEEQWENNDWVNGAKGIFGFNANGDMESMVSQGWNETLKEWENLLRIRLDYATGIQPVKLTGNTLKVYPNPFLDQLTIDHSEPVESGIEVFNSTGQLVNSFKTNKSVTTLNLSLLERGVYFMKIKTPQNEQTIRLLKVN